MTERLCLREYETKALRLSASAARDVLEVSGGKLAVSPAAEQGMWNVTASGWVGAVVTPEVELLIRPKVPMHNLLLLLDVGMPPGAWRSTSIGLETDPSLLAAMAAFFVRTAERVLAAGVRRDYRSEEDRLVTLRGRIDIAGQLRTPGLVSPIACRFDEYTADIVENRALRIATRRLLRLVGVRPEVRRGLERVLVMLEEVSDAPVTPSDIDHIVITRLNRHYAPALRLSALILRNTSLVDRLGRADVSAFLLDMPMLFQAWLTDRLERHLRGRLAIRSEPRIHLGARKAIPMEPDLTFVSRAGAFVYAGDAKYKLTSDGRGRNDDYYQLLAYLTALDLPEGVLVYCQADGGPEQEVRVRHAGKVLRTYPLSLAGSSTEVEASVRELARWIETNIATQDQSADAQLAS
jgi:5-methylcytosine-specific restriction enzyme subunit McrC